MITLIGRLTNGALGWFLPGFGASSLYLAAGAVAFSLVGSFAYFKGADGKGAAIAFERSACELRISESARISSEGMTHLLEVIGKLEDGGDDGKTAAEMCKGSKFCRSRGNK